MRYALRNQSKIREKLGVDLLARIILSLDQAFEKRLELDLIEESGEPYPKIIINDAGHTCGCISFYVVCIKYDVWKLAFCEFI